MVFCTMGGMPRDLVWSYLKAITGWELNDDIWVNEIGRRIIQIQRAALIIGGPDKVWDPLKNDDNPARFYEPLPSGPKKGAAVDRKDFEDMRSKYYAEMGWDEHGIPTSDELRKLGLGDVDRVLNKVVRESKASAS